MSVVLLRASAAVLIVYGYLVGLWIDDRDQQLALLDLSREWLGRPLGLGEDFGPLGVLLLLFTAGYAATRESRKELCLIGALVVLAYVTTPGLIPAGWAALLALAGFAGVELTRRLPNRLAWVSPLAQLVVVFNVVALADVLPAVAGPIAFYPLLVCGQLVHAVRERRIPAWGAASLALAGLALVILADDTVASWHGWWYPVAALFAGLLGTVAVLLAGPTAERITAARPVRWAAERVWWLLLLSTALGHHLADLLHHVLPAPIAVLLAVAGTGLAAEAGHRLFRQASRSRYDAHA